MANPPNPSHSCLPAPTLAALPQGGGGGATAWHTTGPGRRRGSRWPALALHNHAQLLGSPVSSVTLTVAHLPGAVGVCWQGQARPPLPWPSNVLASSLAPPASGNAAGRSQGEVTVGKQVRQGGRLYSPSLFYRKEKGGKVALREEREGGNKKTVMVGGGVVLAGQQMGKTSKIMSGRGRESRRGRGNGQVRRAHWMPPQHLG